MNSLYIFDLDGTLSDLRHRLPYHAAGDWDKFHEECDKDLPRFKVIEVMRTLYYSGADIWVFSGRPERVKEKSINWLKVYGMVWADHWTDENVMHRRDGDNRPDQVIKQEFLDNMLDVDRERLVAVFDDRDRVVKMWRDNGIQCFQVNYGDF